MTELRFEPFQFTASALAILTPRVHCDVIENGDVTRFATRVDGTINSTWSNNVKVQIFDQATIPPGATHATATLVHVDNTQFSHNALEFAYDVVQAGDISVIVWQYDGATWHQATSEDISVSLSNSQKVTAMSCPWFANAPNNYVGPQVIKNNANQNWPPESGKVYRPVEFLVPSVAHPTATQIHISNTTVAQKWNNHSSGGVSTGDYSADGTNGIIGVESTYLIEFGFPSMTNAPSTKLGRLIAVIIYDDGTASDLINIGVSSVARNIVDTDRRADRIIVGFHDAYEWGNNLHSQTVQVTYS